MRFPNLSLVWSYVRTSNSLRRIVGLTVVYFLVCKLGLSLAIIHPSATAVWPGTGIALAAIFLLGYNVWPGIFLGALAVNLTTAGSIVSSLGIAFGNTLEAVLGAYLVIRFANGRKVFDHAEGIFKFFLFACVVATTVSASIGTAALALTGLSRGVHWEALWSTWWLGNMAGAILLTPCLLLWSSRTEARGTRRGVVLQGAALLSLLLVGAIVFGGSLSVAGQDYPLKFICIPFVVWVAFELRPREAALAVLVFSVVAVGSALHAARGASIANGSLLVVQVFLTVVAITGLLVSVAVSERNRHEETLQKAKIELEERVLDRTRELEDRIARQERAEQSVLGLSAHLLQTQDRERRRIARELHDSTGQSLAALTMNLSVLSKKAARVSPELSSALDENTQIVQSVSDELRTTSYLLHPPLLDEMGLQAGLRWYIKGFEERSNIKIALDLPKNLERLQPELELMIFRVVQECLTNVHRHSESPSAAICLHNSGGKLTLEIQDRGKGMPNEKLAAMAGPGTAGVGLRGMRERVKVFGGELEIISDGRGTLVRAIIPLDSSSPVSSA
jgi:two-component system, NarL family, sensor histidine kinase FusK